MTLVTHDKTLLYSKLLLKIPHIKTTIHCFLCGISADISPLENWGLWCRFNAIPIAQYKLVTTNKAKVLIISPLTLDIELILKLPMIKVALLTYVKSSLLIQKF